MDNPETLTTLGTQDTGRRQTKHKNTTHRAKKMSNTDPNKHRGVGENPGTRRLGTQDTGRRQTKHKNTTHRAKKMSNTDPNKHRGVGENPGTRRVN